MRLLRVVASMLAVVLGVAFFWFVVVKAISRILDRLRVPMPCPAALGPLLDNPMRRKSAAGLLDRVGIRPGERVLELGPGAGVFTVEAARRAGPEGRLVAVDIEPRMIARVEARVRSAGLTNVETHVAGAYDLPLATASLDRAFLITVLGEIPDKDRALAELHRVLAPDGLLSVTEQFPDPDYIFPGEMIRRLETAGFRLAARHGGLWTYTLNCRKAASRAPRGALQFSDGAMERANPTAPCPAGWPRCRQKMSPATSACALRGSDG